MLFDRPPIAWIIAGLGNPGQQYANTRHNMGFLTVDLLAERYDVKLNKVKFKAAYHTLTFGGARCLVMKPQTYMNLSGEAVQAAAAFYKIPSDHVLVIYDDISLPVGKIRVRASGSAGGHNGIKSIIQHLGTEQFPRVKIGVGAPDESGEMVSWVTGTPSRADRETLLDSIDRAVGAAECIVAHDGDCREAMNRYN